MRLKILGSIIGSIMILAAVLYAQDTANPHELLNLSGGSRDLGMGSAAVANENEVPALIVNPAALASTELLSISVASAFGNNSTYFMGGVGIPTDYGVVGVAIRYITVPTNVLHTSKELVFGPGLRSGIVADCSWSKLLTEQFYFGFGLTLASINGIKPKELPNNTWVNGTNLGAAVESKNATQIGLNLGAIYKLPVNTVSGGTGIEYANIGLSLCGIGNGAMDLYHNTLALRFGPAMKFLVTEDMSLRLNSDVIFPLWSILIDKSKYPAYDGAGMKWGLGMEMGFLETYFLRAGYLLNSRYNQVSFGASYNLKLKSKDDSDTAPSAIRINLGFQPYMLTVLDDNGIPSEENNMNIILGFDMALGTPDREAPKSELKSDGGNKDETSGEVFISPGVQDGNADAVKVKINIKDNKQLRGYQFEVVPYEDWTDEKQSYYQSPSVEGWVYGQPSSVSPAPAKKTNKKLTLAKPAIVTTGAKKNPNAVYTERKEHTYIAPHTLKDAIRRLFGKTTEEPDVNDVEFRGVDDNGNPLPDGKYVILVKAWDYNNNMATSKPMIVVVDNTPPHAEVTASERIFSPNNDGNKDTVSITQNCISESADTWFGIMSDSRGTPVRAWRWTGQPERTIVWDGKQDNGKVVPDGVYAYKLTGMDKAGNSIVVKTRTIEVNTKANQVYVGIDREKFSPNNDGIADTITLKPVLSSTEGLAQWSLIINSGSGKEVKRWKGTTTGPEASYIWDGSSDTAVPVTDGRYQYHLEAQYENGDAPSSVVYEVMLDRTPPSFQFIVGPDDNPNAPFSPNGDGENELLLLQFKNFDELNNVAEWRVDITDASGAAFRTLVGSNARPPESIVWDGISDTGERVQANASYSATATAIDELGNTTVSPAQPIRIDATAPAFVLEASPQPFGPDDDGHNDTLTINIKQLGGEQGITEWTVTVYPIYRKVARDGSVTESRMTERPFKRWSGTGTPPAQIVWDGKNDNGEEVDSAVIYDIVIECKNILGVAGSAETKVETDILVICRNGICKIRIQNIEFDYNKATIRRSAYQLLNRLGRTLKKFPQYTIVVVGHTDNTGSRERNEELSQQRAESVIAYLKKKGVKNDIAAKGVAWDEPIADNETEYGRQRNRRVEFILKKK